ncbi:MAG: hypothetical protein DRI69_03450, partial [Bacteroidetes bacterium]
KKATLRYTVATASMISMLVAAVATFAMLYFEPGKSDIVATQAAMHAANGEGSTGFSFMSWLGSNLSAMVAIWVVGVVLLAFRLLFGLAYIQYLKQTASDLSFTLGGKLKEISKKINYKRSIDIAESALVQIPVVVGHLKPLILFPVGAINQLTTEEVEAVLAHEIAHLVRNDFVQNLIQSVIEIIFYYHPAVWWISAVVRSERENCCDDLAIQVCGSSLTYARALVRLQEVGQSAPALALPFSGSKNHLLNRVRRILNEPQNKSNLMEKITATTLLLLCLIFASFSDGKEEIPRETIDVPALLVSNHYVHFDNSFVGDTIIPRSTQTIVHGDSDGKEVRLEIENGEIKGLYINGEEVPESRYDEYAEEITVLENSLSNVPAPPAPPAMPAMPPMPPMPPMPDMPPMPPMPAMAPIPPMPPMPPMPDMPPMPNMEGAYFEFSTDGSAPLAFSGESTITRTESTIIREYDDEGNVSYRIEGEHAGDTNIEIDAEAGVAYIDGSEIKLDADEITVIEEIETTPRGYSFFAAPQVGSWNSGEWNEKFNKEFKEKWNSEEFQKQWKENWDQEKWNKQWKENWNEGEWKQHWEDNKDKWKDATKEWKLKMEDSEDGNSQMDAYKKALEEYNIHLEELNGDLEGNDGEYVAYLNLVKKSEGADSDNADEDLIIVRELVRKQRVDGEMSEDEIIKLKKEYQEAYNAASHDHKLHYKELKEIEVEARELKEKKELKKDQSSIEDSGDVQFFAYSVSPAADAEVIVVRGPDMTGTKNVTWTADLVNYDTDTHVVKLTGNVELSVGEVKVTDDAKLVYVGSPDGEESLKGYTVIVSSDHPDLADKVTIEADVIEYKVKVVEKTGSVNGVQSKSEVQKRQ